MIDTVCEQHVTVVVAAGGASLKYVTRLIWGVARWLTIEERKNKETEKLDHLNIYRNQTTWEVQTQHLIFVAFCGMSGANWLQRTGLTFNSMLTVISSFRTKRSAAERTMFPTTDNSTVDTRMHTHSREGSEGGPLTSSCVALSTGRPPLFHSLPPVYCEQADQTDSDTFKKPCLPGLCVSCSRPCLE